MPKFTSKTAKTAGSVGGKKTQTTGKCTTRINHQRASSLGHSGGTETHRKHGSDHMSTIGARGFQTTVQRHYNGNAAAYLEVLHERGQLATCDRELVMMLDLYRQYRPDLLEDLTCEL
jgi:hypothetical protein